MLGDLKYLPIVVTVSTASAQVAVEVDTDKLYSHCTGFFISLPEEVGGTETSTLSRVEIGGKELFPAGYEVKMLNASREVPIDERYYELDEAAKGARFKTVYNDAGDADSYPYTVVFYLRMQNK